MSTTEYWPEHARALDRSLQRHSLLLDSIKGILIGLDRADRDQHRSGIDLAAAVVRSLVCRLKAFGQIDVTAEDVCERTYGRRGAEFVHARQALVDLPGLVARAGVSPANTTVTNWATELTATSSSR
jgi:hypothetical protein